MTKNWIGEDALQLFRIIVGLEYEEDDVHADDVRWKLLSKKHPNDREHHYFKEMMVSACKSNTSMFDLRRGSEVQLSAYDGEISCRARGSMRC